MSWWNRPEETAVAVSQYSEMSVSIRSSLTGVAGWVHCANRGEGLSNGWPCPVIDSARRRRGKTDTVDAEAAARAALSGIARALPKSGDGQVEALRMLRLAKLQVVAGAFVLRCNAALACLRCWAVRPAV
ncbi:hypothetical protein [Streptomyces sp. NBC_01803]|uniref:hypothetical protein n=1 Tax=Streptomyces sp. NBC_01803 TaxID=2975946 RepID=UPI002DD9E53B|nr:hypothetical protein [Streptomyces sp. NBC_01803]